MRKSIVTFLAAGAFAGVVPASAGQTVTVRVPHGDLDLSQADQVEILKTRINAAANDACRVTSNLYAGWSHVDQTCVRDTTKAALAIAEKRMPAQVAVAN